MHFIKIVILQVIWVYCIIVKKNKDLKTDYKNLLKVDWNINLLTRRKNGSLQIVGIQKAGNGEWRG